MRLGWFKHRKEERLKQQRKADEMEYDRDLPQWWEDEDAWNEDLTDEKRGLSHSFLIKIILSLFLVSFTYALHYLDIPFSNKGQQIVSEVMTREFNFEGAFASIEKNWRVNPSLLPVLRTDAHLSQPVWSISNNKKEFLAPVKGEIKTSFVTDQTGIQISAQGKTVKAVEEGWVSFVGQKEGLGHTVIIGHENNVKSWYSGIEDVEVNENDWVESGQLIAQIKPGSSLYFSMKTNGKYVDPASVITFE